MQIKVDLEPSTMAGNQVTYELFYGSLFDLPSSLILDLYEYQHALMNNAVFVPRIQTFDCSLCPDEIIEAHCINGGLYCFTPPNEDIVINFPEVDEKQMLEENIRTKCVYNIVEEYNTDDEHIWFNYVYNTRFSCLEIEGTVTTECSNRVMDLLGINKEAIDDCTHRSNTNYGNRIIN